MYVINIVKSCCYSSAYQSCMLPYKLSLTCQLNMLVYFTLNS